MTDKTLAIIDYGMGNLHSAQKALEHVAARSNNSTRIVVTSDPDVIRSAERVILPGVGAIRDCMGEIVRRKLDNVILDVADEKPFLGICIGLQALMTHSEENGGVDCLNVFKGEVKFFNEAAPKVPHMGWNEVDQVPHSLWNNIPNHARFYFVHSYYAEAARESDVIGYCSYGVRFAAALAKDNIAAVQFHPEKSADAGLQLLENFLHWQP